MENGGVPSAVSKRETYSRLGVAGWGAREEWMGHRGTQMNTDGKQGNVFERLGRR